MFEFIFKESGLRHAGGNCTTKGGYIVKHYLSKDEEVSREEGRQFISAVTKGSNIIVCTLHTNS